MKYRHQTGTDWTWPATNETVLSVSGTDQFNNPIAISGSTTWSSNNGNADVDQNGKVVGVAIGNSTITASVGSISDEYHISVVDTSPVTGTFVYVSDAVDFDTGGGWKIFRYDENGANAIDFITEDLSWPQDIFFMESENQVLISNLNTNKINRYDATTGELLGTFANNISGPTRMKVGADNLLYVLQWSGNGLVMRYELDGTFVDEFTSVGISQSIGLDWDSDGNLYVSSFDGATIRKFDVDGNDMGLYIDSNVQGPTNIWFDENDNLFVNDWSGNRVLKYDSMGSFDSVFIGTGISQPEGIDFFADGSFLLGSGGTSEVKHYSADGDFITDLVSAGSGGLVRPNAVRIRTID